MGEFLGRTVVLFHRRHATMFFVVSAEWRSRFKSEKLVVTHKNFPRQCFGFITGTSVAAFQSCTGLFLNLLPLPRTLFIEPHPPTFPKINTSMIFPISRVFSLANIVPHEPYLGDKMEVKSRTIK